MFYLIGIIWPPKSCSFQIIFPSLCLESKLTEILEALVDYIFYVESEIKIWLKKALEKLNNSLNVKVENYLK